MPNLLQLQADLFAISGGAGNHSHTPVTNAGSGGGGGGGGGATLTDFVTGSSILDVAKLSFISAANEASAGTIFTLTDAATAPAEDEINQIRIYTSFQEVIFANAGDSVDIEFADLPAAIYQIGIEYYMNSGAVFVGSASANWDGTAFTAIAGQPAMTFTYELQVGSAYIEQDDDGARVAETIGGAAYTPQGTLQPSARELPKFSAFIDWEDRRVVREVEYAVIAGASEVIAITDAAVVSLTPPAGATGADITYDDLVGNARTTFDATNPTATIGDQIDSNSQTVLGKIPQFSDGNELDLANFRVIGEAGTTGNMRVVYYQEA